MCLIDGTGGAGVIGLGPVNLRPGHKLGKALTEGNGGMLAVSDSTRIPKVRSDIVERQAAARLVKEG